MSGSLHFYYGTVSSSKSLILLSLNHSYKSHDKQCYLIKPIIDTRDDVNTISSKAGLSYPADLLVKDDTHITRVVNEYICSKMKHIDCILVDEAQFLSDVHIEQLRYIATNYNILIKCYGLKTDWKNYLFNGSKRLIELADTINEIQTICCNTKCNKNAICNLKYNNPVIATQTISKSNINTENDETYTQIAIGGEDMYKAMCYNCYVNYNKK